MLFSLAFYSIFPEELWTTSFLITHYDVVVLLIVCWIYWDYLNFFLTIVRDICLIWLCSSLVLVLLEFRHFLFLLILFSDLSFFLCFLGFEVQVVGGNLLSWNEEISCFWIVLCWIYLRICVGLLLDYCMRMLHLAVCRGERVNLNEEMFGRRDGWRDWKLEWVLMMMMGFVTDRGSRTDTLESSDR